MGDSIGGADGRLVAEWSLFDPIARQSPFGIAIIDETGAYSYVNASYARMYGYREAEMLGASFTMLFPGEERARILELHQALLRDGGTVGGEWEVLRRDGTRLKVISESVRAVGISGRPQRLVYTVDISSRRETELALQESEITFRTLFETIPIGVVYHDLSGRITAANPAALAILGARLEELQGLTPHDPRWQAVREDGSVILAHEHPAAIALQKGVQVRDVVMGIETASRGMVWLRVNATPVFREQVLHSVYASFEDITEGLRLARELSLRATTDALTGAANRRTFIEYLEREFERVRRHPNVNSSVLIVDLDHFKVVNDTRGHAAGDDVLRQVTRVMQAETRRQDIVGRLGGEEFGLLLPETDQLEACKLAQRLCVAIAAQPAQYAAEAIPITVSVGVSVLSPADTSAEAVLLRADAALYRAKDQGRNRIECDLPPAADQAP